MDARAILTSQGWRGSGHSLHKTDDSIGLAKPILVSRKDNTLGIGRKNHVTSDQWWLNAFDEQLKSLDTSNKTSIVQTKTNTKLDSLLTAGVGKYKGANALYACFVSGGMLEGSLNWKHEGESTDATPEAEAAPVRTETKEERRARRAEKKRRKAEKSAKKLARKLAKETAAAVAAAAKPVVTKDKSKKESKKRSKRRAAPGTEEERRARKEAKRKRRQDKEKRTKSEDG
ncbi:putative dna-directed rna polymerase ii subunit rpb1 [Diaporthe ampelina]|uniref:Putative dna-directed rna polymerase ii subunit rpb1 n=1 Tax=Diaporthe ampelina TaxID=1214573 RepID=A0A0G2FU10_9PEZI|nr:putative dna-directed rna polymerase ii subunit rpb1 [Diaporthe ampelina]